MKHDQAQPGTTAPIGFEAARAEWNERFAGRSMTIDDWSRLTFEEQQRYGAAECKTKGAVYSTHVSRDVVSIHVQLPRTLALDGMTEGEAKWIENALHKKMEETLHWIITSRQMGVAT